MKVLDVFRWLMPAVLAALLFVPVQSANARGMGGGGHMGGGRGGGHMGGRVRMGGIAGQRGHPGVTSHFISRTGANGFGRHQNLAFRNHNFHQFAGRTNRFADRGRFGNGRFGREGRFGGRAGFWRGGSWGWGGWGWGGPWWWAWGSPWWWSWGYPYPYYGDYGYGYGYYPYYGDPQGYGSQYDDPQDNGSQYDAAYWNNLAMSVQTKLADQGYYHGQIDGVIGSGTTDAVRKFQADHGLPTTGRIDPQLLNALGIDYKAQSSAITRQKIVI